jgi:small subunit ribosomal protein S20
LAILGELVVIRLPLLTAIWLLLTENKIFLFRFQFFPYLCRPNFKYSTIMANHQATKKDVRQASKRRDSNRYYGKTTRNAIRDLKALKGKEAVEALPGVVSQIDKLVKRGVIHKNKASNLKSKLSKVVKAA